ncbi:hypothetical protein [Luethyella okanaganae]|uniref:Uncharacterized protein n=1 Tax=Luethyella okanaganae TaxID=69372 RepID=A0ABW1VGT6_9MICO
MMATDDRYSVAPVLIGAGAIAQSIGYAILLLAALAALGLDRTGYPVVSGLGHPAWIVIGALLGIIGGIVSGYGYFLVMRLLVQLRSSRTVAPADAG